MMEAYLPFLAIGFLAQLIDGSVGMGFGITANTALVMLGVPPVVSSASVHMAAIFTTGVSGVSHLKFGNVERKLFLRLLIPGMIGGGLGAYFLTHIDKDWVVPLVSIYLLIMGALVIRKSFQQSDIERVMEQFVPLSHLSKGVVFVWSKIRPMGKEVPIHLTRVMGFFGGLLDSIGGGGWGPVVTSTLIARDHSPRYSVGSANLAEFFVSFSASAVFFWALPNMYWTAIIGLLTGGIIGAPIAAFLVKKIPARELMMAVGIFIMVVGGVLLWKISAFSPQSFFLNLYYGS